MFKCVIALAFVGLVAAGDYAAPAPCPSTTKPVYETPVVYEPAPVVYKPTPVVPCDKPVDHKEYPVPIIYPTHKDYPKVYPPVYAPAHEKTCQELCEGTDSCRNDPQEHGSYCKSYQATNVCFGLYQLPYGGLCFEPNDPACDDSKLQPVLCDHDETCETDKDCPKDGSYCMSDPTKHAPFVCHVPN